jgi:hypothetical protein
MASAVRIVSWHCAGPAEKAMISVAAPSLQPDRLFHGDLIEGVHGHLDVRRLDARVVGLDADLDVVVDDPLDRDQHFHRVAPIGELPPDLPSGEGEFV